MAREVADRMIGLFTARADGRRRIYGGTEKFQQDPHWRDLLLFNEYFHGDNGAGLGANHQTGWTGLVANLIDEWRTVTCSSLCACAGARVVNSQLTTANSQVSLTS
jgi:hypothetical protein